MSRSNKPLTIREVLTEKLRLKPDSRQSVYNLIRDHEFPPGFRVGGVGKLLWSESEVDSWLRNQAKKYPAIKRAA